MRRTKQRMLVTVLAGVCWLGMSTAASAAVIYVDASATGLNNGSSWDDAFKKLQDALDSASEGDDIWVAKGTYKPTSRISGAPSDRYKTFYFTNPVNLYGGFNGDETHLSQRNLAMCDGGTYDGKPCAQSSDCPDGSCVGNVTILSGDIDGTADDPDADCEDDSDCSGGVCAGGWCLKGGNAYHIMTYEDADADVRIDGFVFQGGMANGDGAGSAPFGVENQGGALQIRALFRCAGGTNEGELCKEHGCPSGTCIFGTCSGGDRHGESCANDCPDALCVSSPCLSGGPEVYNCLFRHNYASDHAAVNDHGSSSKFDNCVFRGNVAPKGGGLLVDNGSAIISNSLFVDNHATNGGAAWFEARIGTSGCPSEPAIALTDSVFKNNSANEGGAIFSTQAVPIIARCVFDSNSVVGGPLRTGGAIWLGHTPDGATAVIANTLFTRNRAIATNFGIGGALYLPEVSLLVHSCRFVGNTASDFGGAIYQGGHAEYINSEFVGNEATGGQFVGHGGAVIVAGSGASASFVNCTFAANRGEWIGGGVFGSGGPSIELKNCILWRNEANEAVNESTQIDNAGQTCVRYSIVDGLLEEGDFDNGTNLDYDPQFVRDPDDCGGDWGELQCTSGCASGCNDYGDLRLTSGSPAIDAGDNDAIFGYDTDLDGNDRRINDVDTLDTGAPSNDCPYVDMGAYEYDGNPGCCDDSDCSMGEVCCDSVCETGECCEHSDCSGNDVCCDNSCESWECCDNTDCGFGQICCPGYNICRSEIMCPL